MFLKQDFLSGHMQHFIKGVKTKNLKRRELKHVMLKATHLFYVVVDDDAIIFAKYVH